MALIIPTYNQMRYALIAARSAIRNTPKCLVMIVDDGSPEWDPQTFSSLPQRQLLLHQFPKNDRNLTRSWNWGLAKARELGIPYAVPTNSDVKFPKGWWPPLRSVLDSYVAALVGPLTNAPGHRPRQQVSGHYRNYQVGDGDAYLDAVQAHLAGRFGSDTWTGKLNGFCMAAKTDTWWQGAHSADFVFDPKFKMVKNEDELQGRWDRLGLRQAIVPASFVFHYRGVSRGAGGPGKHRLGTKKPHHGAIVVKPKPVPASKPKPKPKKKKRR